jgi:hypothetical protein
MRPILKVFEFYGLVNYIIREEQCRTEKTETCHLCDPLLALLGCSFKKTKVTESLSMCLAQSVKTLVSLASYQNKPGIAIGTRAATAVENRDT